MSALELIHAGVSGRLHDVSVQVEPGRLVGLVGPNGSGKSTLLQVAAGLLPTTGEVRWQGRAISHISIPERGRLAAWVPQEAQFEFGFPVRAVVAQGRFAHGDDGEGVEQALRRLDLEALAERPVNRLSGGERHRVLLARAIVTAAPLMLWDEPLAALDVRHALEVLMLASELKQRGATVVLSLHDLRLAYCLDEVLVLQDGRLRAAGAPEVVLTPELVADVFGVRIRSGTSLVIDLARSGPRLG